MNPRKQFEEWFARVIRDTNHMLCAADGGMKNSFATNTIANEFRATSGRADANC